ncbi:MAG: hypothetical protein M0P61_00290 [Ignavibacteriaceae bacterium]|jgi:hypothetical protein|nr:hypothetical protein [Ignavibacteriaceae bacterium]
MKNLLKKVKVFFKGLFPNIGKEVKPVVIEEIVPKLGPKKRKRIVKKVKSGAQTINEKGKRK